MIIIMGQREYPGEAEATDVCRQPALATGSERDTGTCEKTLV